MAMQGAKHCGGDDGYSRYLHRWIGLIIAALLMVLLTLVMMMLLIQQAQAGGGEVDGASGVLLITGSLTESPCRLDMASADQVVSLGSLGTAQLQQPGDRGAAVLLELRLKDCLRIQTGQRDELVGKRAWGIEYPTGTVSFSALQDADTTGLVEVQGASGIALLLSDRQGKPVSLDLPGTPLMLSPGNNALVYRVTPVRTPAALQAGAYSAVIHFRLFYE